MFKLVVTVSGWLLRVVYRCIAGCRYELTECCRCTEGRRCAADRRLLEIVVAKRLSSRAREVNSRHLL